MQPPASRRSARGARIALRRGGSPTDRSTGSSCSARRAPISTRASLRPSGCCSSGCRTPKGFVLARRDALPAGREPARHGSRCSTAPSRACRPGVRRRPVSRGPSLGALGRLRRRQTRTRRPSPVNGRSWWPRFARSSRSASARPLRRRLRRGLFRAVGSGRGARVRARGSSSVKGAPSLFGTFTGRRLEATSLFQKASIGISTQACPETTPWAPREGRRNTRPSHPPAARTAPPCESTTSGQRHRPHLRRCRLPSLVPQDVGTGLEELRGAPVADLLHPPASWASASARPERPCGPRSPAAAFRIGEDSMNGARVVDARAVSRTCSWRQLRAKGDAPKRPL